jgi:hypothetical protein
VTDNYSFLPAVCEDFNFSAFSSILIIFIIIPTPFFNISNRSSGSLDLITELIPWHISPLTKGKMRAHTCLLVSRRERPEVSGCLGKKGERSAEAPSSPLCLLESYQEWLGQDVWVRRDEPG